MAGLAKKILWPLNAVHLYLGVSIFGHKMNSCLRYWNQIRGLILVTCVAYKLYLNIEVLVFNKTSLWTLSNTIFYSTGVLYVVGSHVNGRSLASQLNSMTRVMCKKQILQLRILVILFSVFLTGDLLYEFQSYMQFLALHPTPLTWYTIVSIIKIFDPFFLSMAFYGVFVSASFFVIENIFKRLLIRSDMNCPIVITRQVRKIQTLVSRANSVAGLTFLSVLAYIAIALPGGISSTFIDRSEQFSGSFDLYIVYLHCLFVSLLIIYVTVQRRRLESSRTQLIDRLILVKESNIENMITWNICLQELNSPALLEFSVMSLFTLDFKLIVSFFASITSLSVLLIQLEMAVRQHSFSALKL